MAENELRCENPGSFLDAVLAAAARGTITQESALRLIFLNRKAGEKGYVWWKRTKLAEHWGVHKTTITRDYEQWTELGLVKLRPNPFIASAKLVICARTLRGVSGYDEIAAELDLLVADTEAQFRDLETLEQRLTALEENIIAIALAHETEAELAQMRRELASELEPHREKMSEEQVVMLERQYRDRWLFESNGLRRLSLFYLRSTELAA